MPPDHTSLQGRALRRAGVQLDAAHAVVHRHRQAMAAVLPPTRSADERIDAARVELAAAVAASVEAHARYARAQAAYLAG